MSPAALAQPYENHIKGRQSQTGTLLSHITLRGRYICLYCLLRDRFSLSGPVYECRQLGLLGKLQEIDNWKKHDIKGIHKHEIILNFF